MVSVVVLAHNHAKYTRACLVSVLESQPLDLELIVIDNGSTDDTPQMLVEVAAIAESKGVACHIISPGKNVGCCTARNMGVEKASGDEVVFMDNDIQVPDPAWLEKLKAVLYSDDSIAIVGPKLCYPFAPHDIQCAGVGISKSGRVLFQGRGEARDAPEYEVQRDVQCLISACWIFRRSLYAEIGGLDEIYNPIQYEDFDLCYRARSHGHRVVYTPDPVIHHWESITSDGTPKLNNRYVIIKNGMRFKERWRSMFEHEDGPSDDETRWQFMDMPSPDGPRRR
jgi:GT2 family glycosyltransferase